MLNFKKIMSAILVSAMAVSGMATVASAKTVLNGVKVFDDSFAGTVEYSSATTAALVTDTVYNGESAVWLRGSGSITVEFENTVDVSDKGMSFYHIATASGQEYEVAIYDENGKRLRYFKNTSATDAWEKTEVDFNSPTTWVGHDADTDLTKIKKVYIQLRNWDATVEMYIDDILIGTETEMPGQVRDKVVRVIYDDKFDDAITWNRQAFGFDMDAAFVDDVYAGEAALKLTATVEGWKQVLAGGKKLDLSADWENAYLEFYVKASAEGAFNVRVTYNNGAETNGEVAIGSNAYVCTPTTDEFTKVSIPLTTYADIEAYKDVITGFSIQGGAANNGQTIYVDNVCFVVKEETPSLEATMADGVITATTSASEGIIIAAVFNGDKFVRAQSVPAPEVDPSTTINIGALAEGETVKLMLFDSLTGIYPVADSVTL